MNTTSIQTIKNSLVESYKLIESLEARLKEINNNKPTMPWETKTEVVATEKPQITEPTNAIKSIVKQMTPQTFNDSPHYWTRMKNHGKHDRVILWKNGMITTFGEDSSTTEPLAVFKNRHCAILRLRKSGWNVPTTIGGCKGMLVATK
jgi:hypothetical protein